MVELVELKLHAASYSQDHYPTLIATGALSYRCATLGDLIFELQGGHLSKQLMINNIRIKFCLSSHNLSDFVILNHLRSDPSQVSYLHRSHRW